MSKLLRYLFLWGMAVLLAGEAAARPRVIVSTDIGGTDEDDFQSMIHYLMYADRFETEGLISSPYGDGRKADILRMIDLYEQDLPKLRAHSAAFPEADALRAVTKQGATDHAPLKGWSEPSEGSDWIIKCAKRDREEPLWVLVWGGLEDVAQALHDAPEIASRLRVYWIGGPNKKWSADVYQYIAANFPDLWMIEANATYRGWFAADCLPGDMPGVEEFYETHIRGRGAMGRDFIRYYDGVIKMGDTPSVAYLLHGDPEKPDQPSWGGRFTPLRYSARRVFEGGSSPSDSVPVFGLVEWVFTGPEQELSMEEPCLWLEVSGQKFGGYYEGEGRYRVRFVPKSAGNWHYRISSPVDELNGLEGQFVSTDPWPGPSHPQDIRPLNTWWSDDPDPGSYAGEHQGAQTVCRWQQDFFSDWAERWGWLE